jgi:hypothetical protein
MAVPGLKTTLPVYKKDGNGGVIRMHRSQTVVLKDTPTHGINQPQWMGHSSK